jgi:hypothetical protein
MWWSANEKCHRVDDDLQIHILYVLGYIHLLCEHMLQLPVNFGWQISGVFVSVMYKHELIAGGLVDVAVPV